MIPACRLHLLQKLPICYSSLPTYFMCTPFLLPCPSPGHHRSLGHTALCDWPPHPHPLEGKQPGASSQLAILIVPFLMKLLNSSSLFSGQRSTSTAWLLRPCLAPPPQPLPQPLSGFTHPGPKSLPPVVPRSLFSCSVLTCSSPKWMSRTQPPKSYHQGSLMCPHRRSGPTPHTHLSTSVSWGMLISAAFMFTIYGLFD